MAQERTMIEVDNLTKEYGQKKAVNGISFKVKNGEVLGFLGPNGAGKTTTMKILTCYMAPSSGNAKVAGHDVLEESLAVRKEVGYLPEDTPLYQDMTTLEFLDYASVLRQIGSSEKRKRIKHIAEVCGLMDVLGQSVGELSKGYRQRVGLAQAMIHDPPILILDEPTSGLDPNQIVEIRELIKEIGKEKTVILSTHILPEVQATCDRVIIIHDGKLVADGTTTELAQQEAASTYRLLVDYNSAEPAQNGAGVDAVKEKLFAISGVSTIKETEGEDTAVGLLVSAKEAQDLRRDIFTCIRDNGWILLELERKSVSLEDVFRKLTREG